MKDPVTPNAPSTSVVSSGFFKKRFSMMEDICKKRGVLFENLTMPDKENLCEEAKTLVG